MTFSLSSRVIITGIHALAALDSSRPCPEDAAAPDLLCPDRVPALAMLVKNEFALLAASMFPYVADYTLDAEDASTASEPAAATDEWLMQLEVPAADALPGHAGAYIRRSVEALLTQRCLAAIYSLEGRPYTHIAERAAAQLASLRAALAPGIQPGASVRPWRV
ncbi:MAG: hypothetical protein HDS11_00620 [Bacteroides sp.]|nr:hypothetical protein [Bacteroidales bacterium]MBD5316164.1 hypothetical protein [Bacteroides sp.]